MKGMIPITRITVKQLDELFREDIRKRAIKEAGGCERCLSPKYDKIKENGDIFPAWKQLDTAHFIPRGNYHIRWDEDNAAGLCGGCHRAIDDDFTKKDEFVKTRLGDRFELLQGRQHQTGKVDRNAIYLYLLDQLKKLDREGTRGRISHKTTTIKSKSRGWKNEMD